MFFSTLLAPLSSPCLQFRLLVYILMTRSSLFSFSSSFAFGVLLFSSFSMCSPLRWNSSVYCIFFSFLFSFPILSSCVHFSTHVEYFSSFSSFVRSSFSFVRFIFSMQGRLKISQTLNVFETGTLRVGMEILVKLFCWFSFRILYRHMTK